MPNVYNPDVPPAWHAIRLDETEFWDETFRKEFDVKKIWGVYIADLHSRTYCCEITPSHALYFIGSVADVPDEVLFDEEKWDRLSEEIMRGDRYARDASYVHCHVIKALSDDQKHAIEIEEDDWRDDPDDGYNVACEAYGSNPVW